MDKYLPFIKSAVKVLEENDLLSDLRKNRSFYDEPFINHYTAIIDTTPLKNSHEINDDDDIQGQGYSYTSKYIGLSKCLGEAIERTCLFITPKGKIQYSVDIPQNIAFDGTSYKKMPDLLQSSNVGFVKGFDFTKKIPCLIPAQLVFINYNNNRKEPRLTEENTNGGAGGFDQNSALLSGIYELVERDAFMTMYLNKIPAKKIDISTIKNKKIQSLRRYIQRYNLELYLFDITNDLQIPSFMSLLIDRTGVGAAVTVGLRSGLDIHQTIIGSIEESMLIRISLRYEIYKNKSQIVPLQVEDIRNIIDRGMYWSSLTRLKELDFLLDQTPVKFTYKKISSDKNEELDVLRDIFLKNNIDVYYAEVTHPIFKNTLPYLVYKVVIPKLQPLYLFEHNRVIRDGRLKAVSHYFGQNNNDYNTTPHPFM